MRQAINENPRVQMIVVGVMLVIGVFLLFTKVLKKEEAPVTDPAVAAQQAAEEAGNVAPGSATAVTSSDPTAATGTDPAATAPAATATAPVDPAATAPVAPAPDVAAAGADGLLPTKGLPKDVLIAYARGNPIALLVIDPKAIADKQVKRYTEAIGGRDDIEVLIVDVKDVADYSRITSGVAVSRTPALVVIRPRKLTENVPTATVSYGFRDERSVQQAIDDALYKGDPVDVYP